MKKIHSIIFSMFFALPAWSQPWSYVSHFGSSGNGDGQFGTIHGIALDPSGNFYVADASNNRVSKFNSAGTFITKWGTFGSADGQFTTPRGIFADGTHVYVAEYFGYRVQKFTSDGTYVTKWGTQGAGDGQFQQANGVATNATGSQVLVLDQSQARVQRFSNSGTYSLQFSVAPGNSPNDIVINSNNMVFVAVSNPATIKRYNTAGLLVTSWSSPGTRLAVDNANNVYAASDQTVYKYSSTGTLLAEMTFAVGSAPGQVNDISCIAVDASNNLYIGDYNNDRIQKFQPIPDIAIRDEGQNSIAAGATLNWEGSEVQRFNWLDRQFYIKNNGLTTLTINAAASSITGAHASDYTFLDLASISGGIAPGEQASFTVRCTPGAVGNRTATINIASNDPGTPTYSFNLGTPCIKAYQTFTFDPVPVFSYGATVPLAATSTAGLAATTFSVVPGYTAYGQIVQPSLGNYALQCNAVGDIQIRVREFAGTADYEPGDQIFVFTITKANQTINFPQPDTKTYGDASFNITATSSAALPVSFQSSNPSVATVTGNTVTIVGAGTTDITASQAGNENYNAATNVIRTLTVNPRPITVTANAGQSKTFGAADPVLSFQVTPALLSGDNLTGALTRTTGENAGTYAITQGTLTAGAKYAITFVSNNFTINKANPVLSFTSANNGVYGTTVNLSVSTGGSTGAVSYNVTNGTGSGSISGSTLTLTGAGGIMLGAAIESDANYNAASISGFAFTVAKADPVISITSPNTTVYGSALQLTADKGGSTGSASFNVNSESIGFGTINESSVFSPMSVGALVIELTVAADENYNSAFATQSFTVTPKPVTVTGVAVEDKTYDGTTAATLTGTPQLSGIVPGDILTLQESDVSVAFSSENAGQEVPVIVSGFAIGNDSNVNPANYELTQPSLTGSIYPKLISISGISAVSKIYDGTTHAAVSGTPILEGVIASDVGNVSLLEGQHQFSSADAGVSKPLTLSYSLSGTASGNYMLSPIDLFANILAKPITVTALAGQTKIYGQADPVLMYAVDPPLLNGDAFTGSLSRQPGEDAGAYAISLGTLSAGNNYATTFVPDNFVVTKASQSITFEELSDKTYGDANFNLQGSATSALPVVFESDNLQVATIDGTVLTIVGAGTATITASQEGNGNYLAATPVQRSFVVNKAAQTIVFAAIWDKSVNDPPFELEASSSSGLGVTYVVSGPAQLIQPNIIHLTGTGIVEVTANQSGNNNFLPAASVTRTFNVTTKSSQTISFAQLNERTFDQGNFTLSATASSGQPVSFESSDPNVAEIDGARVIVKKAGTTTITARQPGNDEFNAAFPVERVLTILKGSQTITFNALADKRVGDAPFELKATSSSGLGVTFHSGNTAVATITGTLLTIHGPGEAVITATQPGDDNYLPAPEVNNTLKILEASRIIQLEGNLDFGDKIIGTGPDELSLTINNTGSDPLHISEILSPPGFSTSVPTAEIPAQGNIVVKVIFSPSSDQIFEGVIVVVSNATSGINSIGVRGRGLLITSLEDQHAMSIKLFPNPTTTQVVVEGEHDLEPGSFHVTDITGRQVPVRIDPLAEGKVKVNFVNPTDGIYLLKIKTTKGEVVKRVQLLSTR